MFRMDSIRDHRRPRPLHRHHQPPRQQMPH